ncbi:hypothetical protein LIER_23405 [Lithospermum erythrorhizon]|uniref:Uncharacterized protein n=1 Tax=Lithospermum erythrorhizon TaxID=34254 RepID=A0AAV3QYM0_LITER
MKNAIRCCISCILPCGSLDVIRIVHANGRVEEISGTIKASDIMEAYPKHILKKPSTFSFEEDQGLCPKIVVVSPDAQLQRGKIYFLMPAPITKHEKARSRSSSSSRKKNKEAENNHSSNNKKVDNNNVASDKYLSDILSEKTSATQRDRRRGRSNVWRPHLDSICETPIEAL